MSEPIKIRAAIREDIALMARWAQAMALETEHKTLNAHTLRRGIELGLDNPTRARYFIAERAGEAAGTLMFTSEWSDWRCAWWWWIQSVYVAPAHRRKGVYRALYAHVLAMAEATPEVFGLRLYVERDNADAQRTYLSLGMNDAGYLMFEAALKRD